MGNLPAGTLLWASSAGQDEAGRRMALRVWRSNDVGRSWSYLSSCATAGNTGGLWEPEFSVAADGALVCTYADETDPGHSQKLSSARSYDGVRWQDHRDTVASTWSADRPGMPVVRRLPNGTYMMSFEICNPGGQYQCVVHYRTSADGWNWGDPAFLGYRPQTVDGKYFRAAPTSPGRPRRTAARTAGCCSSGSSSSTATAPRPRTAAAPCSPTPRTARAPGTRSRRRCGCRARRPTTARTTAPRCCRRPTAVRCSRSPRTGTAACAAPMSAPAWSPAPRTRRVSWTAAATGC
ncbi:hypothetical protein ACFQ60_42530 [Streptomyces zhihengii]